MPCGGVSAFDADSLPYLLRWDYHDNQDCSWTFRLAPANQQVRQRIFCSILISKQGSIELRGLFFVTKHNALGSKLDRRRNVHLFHVTYFTKPMRKRYQQSNAQRT